MANEAVEQVETLWSSAYTCAAGERYICAFRAVSRKYLRDRVLTYRQIRIKEVFP